MSLRLMACTLAALSWAVAPITAVAEAIFYSPLGAIAVVPSDRVDARVTVEPHCCPSTAIVVRAAETVEENELQWVLLGLDVPATGEIKRVTVCYAIDAATPGTTYISQTRLTEMRRPDTATVRLDDPTDRTDPGPACYNVETGFRPRGAVSLHLKIVIGDPSDQITIGMIRVRLG
jgi:hypothetical protein